MKAISTWANRQTYPAIGLLIACEVVNGYNGIRLGTNDLAAPD